MIFVALLSTGGGHRARRLYPFPPPLSGDAPVHTAESIFVTERRSICPFSEGRKPKLFYGIDITNISLSPTEFLVTMSSGTCFL
jgi:hypothetical protein